MIRKSNFEYEAPLCELVEVNLERTVLAGSSGEKFDDETDLDGEWS